MGNGRVEMHRLEELVRLHRMGVGPREAARMLKMGPNVERKYRTALAAEGLLDGLVDHLPALDALKAAIDKHHPPAPLPEHQTSSLDPYREPIAKWAPSSMAATSLGRSAGSWEKSASISMTTSAPCAKARSNPAA